MPDPLSHARRRRRHDSMFCVSLCNRPHRLPYFPSRPLSHTHTPPTVSALRSDATLWESRHRGWRTMRGRRRRAHKSTLARRAHTQRMYVMYTSSRERVAELGACVVRVCGAMCVRRCVNIRPQIGPPISGVGGCCFFRSWGVRV